MLSQANENKSLLATQCHSSPQAPEDSLWRLKESSFVLVALNITRLLPHSKILHRSNSSSPADSTQKTYLPRLEQRVVSSAQIPILDRTSQGRSLIQTRLAPKLIPEELQHWWHKEVKTDHQEQFSMNVLQKRFQDTQDVEQSGTPNLIECLRVQYPSSLHLHPPSNHNVSSGPGSTKTILGETKRPAMTRCSVKLSLIKDSKILLLIGRRLIGRYLPGPGRKTRFSQALIVQLSKNRSKLWRTHLKDNGWNSVGVSGFGCIKIVDCTRNHFGGEVCVQ